MVAAAAADEIQMNNGDLLKGNVTAYDGTTITIQTAYGILQGPRRDVLTVCIGDKGKTAAPPQKPIPTGALVPEGAIAYFDFNQNTSAATGKHNGKLAGSPAWTADRHGRPQSALKFSGGSGEQVVVDKAPDLAPRQITISAWVTGENVKRWARIVDNLAYHRHCGYALIHHERKGVFAFDAFGKGNKRIWVESRSRVSKEWQHVTATYDGRTARIYINGALENEALFDTELTDGEKELTIGGGFDGQNHFPWSGAIDDVRIYSRALTPEEIKHLYQEQDGPLGTTDLMHRDRL